MIISREKYLKTMARALLKGYFAGLEEKNKKEASSGYLVRSSAAADPDLALGSCRARRGRQLSC